MQKNCTLNKESAKIIIRRGKEESFLQSLHISGAGHLNMGITTSEEHRHINPSKSKLFLKKRMVAVAINYWPSFCLFLSDPGVPGVRSMGLVVSN